MKSKPIPPGEVLKKDFLEPMGLSVYKLSRETKIPKSTLSHFIGGGTMTTINCLILSKFFGLSDEYWLNLQQDNELRICKFRYMDRLNSVPSYKDVE